MKKLAIAAVAAIAATVSLGSVAEAHRHDDDEWGRHHHPRHVDVIVFRPHCKTIKIVEFGRHGDRIVKIIRKCR
jgi:hypothetical protein